MAGSSNHELQLTLMTDDEHIVPKLVITYRYIGVTRIISNISIHLLLYNKLKHVLRMLKSWRLASSVYCT